MINSHTTASNRQRNDTRVALTCDRAFIPIPEGRGPQPVSLLEEIVTGLIFLLVNQPITILGHTSIGQNPLVSFVTEGITLAILIYYLVATVNALAAGSGKSRWLLFGVWVLVSSAALFFVLYGLGAFWHSRAGSFLTAARTQVSNQHTHECRWRRERAVVKNGSAPYNHLDKKPVRTIRCQRTSGYCINGDVLNEVLCVTGGIVGRSRHLFMTCDNTMNH
jgi:hypothetical protein